MAWKLMVPEKSGRLGTGKVHYLVPHDWSHQSGVYWASCGGARIWYRRLEEFNSLDEPVTCVRCLAKAKDITIRGEASAVLEEFECQFCGKAAASGVQLYRRGSSKIRICPSCIRDALVTYDEALEKAGRLV